MTPAETEHFSALRMHVAHLHAALKEAIETFVPADAETRPRLEAPLKMSEGEVGDLLKEADRDNALVQARARIADLERGQQQLVAQLVGVQTAAAIAAAAIADADHDADLVMERVRELIAAVQTP